VLNATFTIAFGPPKGPATIVEAFENAGRLKLSGNAEPWDEFFKIQENTLRECAEGGAQSLLGELVAHVVGSPLRRLVADIGFQVRDGLTYPTFVVDLAASKLEDGTPLEAILDMPTARARRMSGKSLKFEI
jgi:hypothetical protein